MIEKYPTCPECGSAELNVSETLSVDRCWRYSAGTERSLDHDDDSMGEINGAICRDCGHDCTETDEIVWKAPES